LNFAEPRRSKFGGIAETPEHLPAREDSRQRLGYAPPHPGEIKDQHIGDLRETDDDPCGCNRRGCFRRPFIQRRPFARKRHRCGGSGSCGRCYRVCGRRTFRAVTWPAGRRQAAAAVNRTGMRCFYGSHRIFYCGPSNRCLLTVAYLGLRPAVRAPEGTVYSPASGTVGCPKPRTASAVRRREYLVARRHPRGICRLGFGSSRRW